MTHLSYGDRAALSSAPFAKSLFALMEKKQTNLALSADVLYADELLTLADTLGPELCLLKTHIDILRDFSPAMIAQLQALSDKHQFYLFEDRKFADIGQTVKYQYEEGMYRISDWAHLTNAHALPGPKQIESLAEVGVPKQRGLLLIAEMSSEGHLMTQAYRDATLALAGRYPQFVAGFITQHALAQDQPHWLYMAPGIHLDVGGDTRGQQYVTPEKAIINHGIDVIIVGRGIVRAEDSLSAAHRYRECGWRAYLKRLESSSDFR